MSENYRQATLFDRELSAGDSPVRTYRWLDSVLDLLESAADSGTNLHALSSSSLPSGFASKTSLGFCHRTADGTWEPSSGRWGTWAMGSPTACLTLSGSEFHSAAAACSLSDVLETGDVPQKFFLSAKACRGILRRAARRGRELPPDLLAALESAAIPLDEGERTT